MTAICFPQKNIETTHYAGIPTSTAANERPSGKKGYSTAGKKRCMWNSIMP